MTWKTAATLALLVWMAATAARAQLADSVIEPGHPAIAYGAPAADLVAALNRRLAAGEVRLAFEERTGYLRSLLGALDVPIESQIALFSGTSLQSRIINSRNPRTIYSDAFDALPAAARDAVYRRLWQILSGQDATPKYARLSAADRLAIVEILRDTKKDLPAVFSPAVSRP